MFCVIYQTLHVSHVCSFGYVFGIKNMFAWNNTKVKFVMNMKHCYADFTSLSCKTRFFQKDTLKFNNMALIKTFWDMSSQYSDTYYAMYGWPQQQFLKKAADVHMLVLCTLGSLSLLCSQGTREAPCAGGHDFIILPRQSILYTVDRLLL